MISSNDGGLQGPTPTGSEFASKPAWSVESLRDLNEAVRRGRRADDPWRLRQDAERVACDRARAARAREEKAAESAPRGKRAIP